MEDVLEMPSRFSANFDSVKVKVRRPAAPACAPEVLAYIGCIDKNRATADSACVQYKKALDACMQNRRMPPNRHKAPINHWLQQVSSCRLFAHRLSRALSRAHPPFAARARLPPLTRTSPSLAARAFL